MENSRNTLTRISCKKAKNWKKFNTIFLWQYIEENAETPRRVPNRSITHAFNYLRRESKRAAYCADAMDAAWDWAPLRDTKYASGTFTFLALGRKTHDHTI